VLGGDSCDDFNNTEILDQSAVGSFSLPRLEKLLLGKMLNDRVSEERFSQINTGFEWN
jgi:hypothetical protein